MTDKRFELAYEKGNWWTVRDGDITLWKEEVIGLLNQLNDENEQLKFQLDECQNHKLYSRRELEKENEQLKKQLQSEHQMLQNAILLERTRMGKNSLKQYKEAIQ